MLRSAICVVVALGLLSGCEGTSDTASEVSETTRIDPVAWVDSLDAASQKDRTVRGEMIASSNGDQVMSAQITIDLGPPTRMYARISEGDDLYETIFDGQSAYTRDLAASSDWIRLDDEFAAEATQFMDAANLVTEIRAGIISVEKVGPHQPQPGGLTTYLATVDLVKGAQASTDPDRDELLAALEQPGAPQTVEYLMVVDDQNRTHSVSFSLAGQTVDMVYSRHGDPVMITGPPDFRTG